MPKVLEYYYLSIVLIKLDKTIEIILFASTDGANVNDHSKICYIYTFRFLCKFEGIFFVLK